MKGLYQEGASLDGAVVTYGDLCARSWLHARDRPAPVSIPHTVRFPICARKLQASMVKVRKEGAVNSGANQASRLASETGTGSVASGGIGGIPFSSAVS
jgi:hypothetical protein